MIPVFFAYFALMSMAAAVLTVALRNPVHCGLALLALLLHVSGLFVLLNAEFLWAVQVVVYAGAILVLYLFVLMLLNLKTEERYFHSTYLYFVVPTLLGSLYVLALLFKSPYGGAKGDAPARVAIARFFAENIAVQASGLERAITEGAEAVNSAEIALNA